MQISGPWPPYHFVHRLTRTAHAHARAGRVAAPLSAMPLPATGCGARPLPSANIVPMTQKSPGHGRGFSCQAN